MQLRKYVHQTLLEIKNQAKIAWPREMMTITNKRSLLSKLNASQSQTLCNIYLE